MFINSLSKTEVRKWIIVQLFCFHLLNKLQIGSSLLIEPAIQLKPGLFF